MSELKNAKKNYDEIPIPEELSVRVQEAIDISNARRQAAKKAAQMRRRKWIGTGLGAAAAIMISFTTMLNVNTAFAESMDKIPVIGELAKILNFKSYEEENEGNWKISVEIPSLELVAKENEGLADSVNWQIYDYCKQYAADAVERAKEYKKAFMETGGTKEEWAAHNITIKVWYEIKSQTENYLSFVVRGSESWTSAYDESRYYNLDLKTEKLIDLKDVLGENYIQIANESIQEQMKTRTLENGMTFWTPDKGGFESISDKTKFYINEAGNPVIVFGKYEIAPGAAGEIEFEIPKNRQTPDENKISSKQPEESAEKGYRDNFDVEASEAAAFAEEIKTAVAEENLEMLADLASYPLYAGFSDGGVSVTSREELLALGAERIFTAQLKEAIAAADVNDLPPSRAGFCLKKDGKPNIIFSLSDEKLAIKGINY